MSDFWAGMEARAEQRRQERERKLSVPCPAPRCPAGVGKECTTPNGWRTYHKARERALNGELPKPKKFRLTEAGAMRIEVAAENGRFYAPGQYAWLRGDAAARASADALERAGLVVKVSEDPHGERAFVLTVAGWKVYRTHPKVIRRLAEEQIAAGEAEAVKREQEQQASDAKVLALPQRTEEG